MSADQVRYDLHVPGYPSVGIEESCTDTIDSVCALMAGLHRRGAAVTITIHGITLPWIHHTVESGRAQRLPSVTRLR